MNTRKQLFIDKNIVKPIMILMNILVRVLGKILSIDHSLDKDFKTIAICKYKGMGSILQSTPLLQTLRLKYPNARIIYITTKSNLGILAEIKIIDKVIYLDDSSFSQLISSFPSFMLNLIRQRIELYLDLEIYSNMSSLIAVMSVATNRIGFYLRSSSYRMGIYTHMMFFNTHNAVSKTYLQLARLLGCKELVSTLYPLKSPVHNIQINESVSLNLLTEKYVVINPNASDLRIERRWDKENFVQIIQHIRKSWPNYKIFLIGSKNEKAYTDALLSEVKEESVFSLAGKTDIQGLIALIQHAHLMITNDTGPMHIAFSTGSRTIALFGPCDPYQYGSGDNCRVVYKKLYCSPCVHEFEEPPCKGNNQCMKLITTKEVMGLIDEEMNRTGTKTLPAKDSEDLLYKTDNDEVLGIVRR